MTKMAAMSIYGKNSLKIFSLGTTGPILMKLGMKHRRPKPIIFCSRFDPVLTTYFMARSNFATYMGKCVNDGFFGNYCIL